MRRVGEGRDDPHEAHRDDRKAKADAQHITQAGIGHRPARIFIGDVNCLVQVSHSLNSRPVLTLRKDLP